MRILYVDIDTLRPDHLGCYGYPRATSTNIDKVAEDSVRFTDVYCSDAPCLPSRAALMTGRFGIHTGCVGHGGVNAEMRWEGRNRGMADFNGRYNLPAVLRRAGMKTASISSFPDRHAAWWFNGGFDETYNIGKRGLEPAHEVIPVALDWLDRKRDTKDWFLHVHVWDPHIPYRTPTEYGEPFKDAPLPDPWMTQEILDKHRATKPGGHSACEVTGYDNKPNPATPRQPVEIKNTDDFRHMIDEYDTGIWYADKQLGLLFDKLREQGIYDDMAIIISSDHGEDLGEMGSYCEHGEADYTYPLSFLEHLYQQQTYHNRNNGGHHPRHHERMIQNPFSNACCSCTVKIYSCHYCRIIRNKEISVDSREQSNQHHRRNTQCYS